MVLAYVVGLVLLVYCLLDVLRTPADQVRSLPKLFWLLLVLAPIIGPLAWLLGGRPLRQRAGGRAAPARGAPDDDEDFLRELRRRAQERKRRARDPRDDDQP